MGHVSVLLRKRGTLGNWVRALGPGLLRIAASENDSCCQQEFFLVVGQVENENKSELKGRILRQIKWKSTTVDGYTTYACKYGYDGEAMVH